MSVDPTGKTIVFAGPSLPIGVRPIDPDIVWLPPVKAGDTFALADGKPKAVVIIDGLFDSVPAVRHKEILLLLARGVPVIGGASMGALRAAELHTFGMIGVGEIFAAFASGRLTGDDEVAVMHGPPDWDWTPLTEALVNVRATIGRAVKRRVFDAETGRKIVVAAIAIFYQDRTWPVLLADIEDRDIVSTSQSRRFRDWLVVNTVNLKQRDALACLDRVAGLDAAARRARTDPPATIFTDDLRADVEARLIGR